MILVFVFTSSSFGSVSFLPSGLLGGQKDANGVHYIYNISILYHVGVILGLFFWYFILGSESCCGGESFSEMLVGKQMINRIKEKKMLGLQ